MGNKEAKEQLKGFLLKLKVFKMYLEQTKSKFTEIAYYEKFIFGFHPPSPIPINISEEFWNSLSSTQKLLLEFRKSFNENDLPEDIRQAFVNMTITIVQNKFDVDKGVIKIGGLGKPWWKEVGYVKKNWGPMEYDVKVIYSQEAYSNISYYFVLIGQIEQLEAMC